MAVYENDASNTLPAFGEAGDSIVNIGFIVTGDSEGEIVTLYTGANVTIDAGEGDNTINNGGKNVSIVAGKGEDFITNESIGTGTMIDGGRGNDTIDNAATIPFTTAARAPRLSAGWAMILLPTQPQR